MNLKDARAIVLAIVAGCGTSGASPAAPPDAAASDLAGPESVPDAAAAGDRTVADAPAIPAADAAGPELAGPDSGVDAAEAGPACNRVDVDKPVEIYQRDVSAPAARGGAIVDGRYLLYSSQIFYGPGGPMTGSTFEKRWGALVLTGGTFEHVLIDQGPPLVTVRESGTFTVSGKEMNLTYSCPAGTPPAARAYTLEGDTLAIYRPARPGVVEELTYQRR
jgi:hypothetical protein